jgi:hypothetical protein
MMTDEYSHGKAEARMQKVKQKVVISRRKESPF